MNLTEFEKFLSWLSPDREHAGRKYEEIRKQLIRFFTCWGCSQPEDLADNTIDRVVPWMEQRDWVFSGEPIRLFYGFARNLRHEERRKSPTEPISSDIPHVATVAVDKEQNFVCLEACIARLPEEESRLIRLYYQYDRQEKIQKRQELANELGVGMNALRIQAWKIRNSLRRCLDRCIESKSLN